MENTGYVFQVYSDNKDALIILKESIENVARINLHLKINNVEISDIEEYGENGHI